MAPRCVKRTELSKESPSSTAALTLTSALAVAPPKSALMLALPGPTIEASPLVPGSSETETIPGTVADQIA